MGLLDFLKDLGSPDFDELARQLREAELGIRFKAVERLDRSSDPRATELLVSALGNDERSIGRMAAERLVSRRSDDLVMRLIAFVEEDDPLRRLNAAKALRGMREPRAVEALAKAVDHLSDWELRQEAIEALGDIGDPGGVEALIQELENDAADDGPRALAACSLAQIGDPLAIEPLERVLAGIPPEQLEDDDVGHSAHEALAELRLKNPEVKRARKPAATSLLKQLKDSSPRTRARAAGGLGRRGDESTIPALIAALSDTDPIVRAAAAESLGKMGDRRAVPALGPLLYDTGLAVIQEYLQLTGIRDLVCGSAAAALGALGGEEAEGLLMAALKSESAEIRRPVALALVETSRHRATLAVLAPLLDDPDSEVRYTVAVRLGDWKTAPATTPVDYTDGDVFAVLETAFAHPDEDVRVGAVLSISAFAERPRARELMRAALDDPYSLVREDAVYQLGARYSIEGDDTRDALPRILEMLRDDPESGVRGNAAQAIGHYFQRADDEPALIAALNDPDEQVRRRVRGALAALRGEPMPLD